jgi:alkaline phosphatase
LTAPLDLAIGGGGCLYLPRAHAQSCRSDDADLVALAQRQGWDVRFGKAFNVSSELAVAAHAEKASQQAMPHLDSLSTTSLNDDLFAHAKTPLLTLLSPSNTPYEIDRLSLPSSLRAAFPPLKSLALSALRLLSESKSNKKGLLLMIEGSQIDLGGHMNDPATHVREIVAYQEAIQAVREWVDAANKRGERSVLISESPRVLPRGALYVDANAATPHRH